MTAAWPVPLSGALAERLEPGRVLGSGPGGVVVRCRERASGRELVLKHSAQDQQGDAVLNARFVREGRALGQVSHRGVLRVLECGEDQGARYLLLEYIDGPALDQIVEKRGALTPAEAVKVTAALLDALAAVHRAGILHRDVKPGNIVIAPKRGPVLIDFGIARTLLDSRALTGSGLMVGTPAYLAPEIILGQPADNATDLYAAALVLHFLLLGRATFSRPKVFDALEAQTEQPPAPIPNAPPALAALLTRWLEKDTGRRGPADAAARRTELERLVL